MRSIPNQDHRLFGTPSVWVACFEITLGGSTYRYTSNVESVVVDGYTYTPFPVELADISEDGQGDISSVKLICSNISDTLSTAIRTSKDVDGQPVVYKLVSIRSGYSNTTIYTETMEIIKIDSISKDSVVFEVGPFNPFLIRLLQEKFLTDFCWNTYKGKGCYLKRSTGTYSAPSGFTTGSPDTCDRSLEDCRRHVNSPRFNSFPGIPGYGGYI